MQKESHWHLFLSHASEDKPQVAQPLFDLLTLNGFKVWYDKAELVLGDSLRRNIDEGLSKTDFGVVLLSHSFFC